VSYRIAIDIGTTNIEYKLYDYKPQTGFRRELSGLCSKNCNIRFGADVMTRIGKAAGGNLTVMTAELRAQLKKDIDALVNLGGLRPDAVIDCIAIAANTTMVHILMGYDCSSLGTFPFTPVDLGPINTDAAALGFEGMDCDIFIFPGLSAFVGGDIVSGISYINSFITVPSVYLFLDLGTNAEMVLMTADNIFTTTAAAGPAFETCAYGKASVVIDALADMRSKGIIDETGLMSDEYFDTGIEHMGINFSQKKIRDFQMAKSAIRTGIDILVAESGVNIPDIEKIFIAGTFGQNLNIDHAIYIGMLPSFARDLSSALGNSSLKGASLNVLSPGFGTAQSSSATGILNGSASSSQKNIREINLANHPDFNSMYIANMNL